MNNIIVISGADGAGKSSIIECINSNKEYSIVWSRYFHFFQKAFNLVGRMLGRSYYQNINGIMHGYHDYKGFFGIVYLLFSIIDNYINYCCVVFSWHFRKDKIIYDRFMFDRVVDLIVDGVDPKLVVFFYHFFLVDLIKRSKVVIIDCDHDVIIHRRPELKDDSTLGVRLHYFRVLARLYKVPKCVTDKMSISSSSKFVLMS